MAEGEDSTAMIRDQRPDRANAIVLLLAPEKRSRSVVFWAGVRWARSCAIWLGPLVDVS